MCFHSHCVTPRHLVAFAFAFDGNIKGELLFSKNCTQDKAQKGPGTPALARR